ncbi:MAG: dihydroneopterin aldolase [Acidiferrobacteraceae bacterium]
MMDIIYLRNLQVDCVIGIWDWERQVTQRIAFDLCLAVDVTRAANHDRIEDAVNYKSVAKRILAYAGASRFSLVETLAEQCASLLLAEFPVPWLWMRVNKQGAIRGASDVGIILERGTRPASLPLWLGPGL